jgi:chromosomal replication initiation ATPase DnaA
METASVNRIQLLEEAKALNDYGSSEIDRMIALVKHQQESKNKLLQILYDMKQESLAQSQMIESVVMTDGKYVTISFEDFANKMCQWWGCELKDIAVQDRHDVVKFRRYIVAKALRIHYKNQDISLKEIGNLLGGRDHTTVIEMLRSFDELLETKYLKFMKEFEPVKHYFIHNLLK